MSLTRLKRLRLNLVDELTEVQRDIDLCDLLEKGILINRVDYERLMLRKIKFKFKVVPLKYGVIDHMAREDKLIKYYKAGPLSNLPPFKHNMLYQTEESFTKLPDDLKKGYTEMNLGQISYVVVLKGRSMTQHQLNQLESLRNPDSGISLEDIRLEDNKTFKQTNMPSLLNNIQARVHNSRYINH